jgi:TatA/E family protein of Tat protein translocase
MPFRACLRRRSLGTILLSNHLDAPQGVVAPTPPSKSVVRPNLRVIAADAIPFHPFSTGAKRMFGLGMAEIVVVCIIGLVLFGNRLPGLARSLGKALMEFRKDLA